MTTITNTNTVSTQNRRAAARLFLSMFTEYCESHEGTPYTDDPEARELLSVLKESLPEMSETSNFARLFISFSAGVNAGIGLALKLRGAEQ